MSNKELAQKIVDRLTNEFSSVAVKSLDPSYSEMLRKDFAIRHSRIYQELLVELITEELDRHRPTH